MATFHVGLSLILILLGAPGSPKTTPVATWLTRRLRAAISGAGDFRPAQTVGINGSICSLASVTSIEFSNSASATAPAQDGAPDMPALTKETLKELKLVPEDIHEASRGSDIFKRLLSNLGTIGNGLAARPLWYWSRKARQDIRT